MDVIPTNTRIKIIIVINIKHFSGTEASAATAATMNFKSSPLQFSADKPFIFLIQDDKSKEILFMGRVVNPTTTVMTRRALTDDFSGDGESNSANKIDMSLFTGFVAMVASIFRC